MKKWIVSYDHNDGRKGSIIVETEIDESHAFDYGNRKYGRLSIENGEEINYDLRYCKGDLHLAMISEFFGAGLVDFREM